MQNIVPFIHLFPEQGTAEIRTITLQSYPGIPDGEYGLLESYCTDFTCDCRRVLFNIIGKDLPLSDKLATISYGFDRDAKMAGPFLDPFNPQSEYSEPFLDLVTEILETDEAYVARLHSHYEQFKEAIENPSQAMLPTLRRLRIDSPNSTARTRQRITGANSTKAWPTKHKRPKRVKTAGAQKRKKRRKK